MLVWGIHTIENYFLSQDSDFHHHNTHSQAQASQCRLYILGVPGRTSTAIDALCHKAQAAGIPIVFCPSAQDKRWPLRDPLEEAVHQRVCLQLEHSPLGSWENVIQCLEEEKQNPGAGKCLGVVLDHMEDSRNVGAVIRSAVFLGLRFVLAPKQRQAPFSGHVAKASAGGLFRVPCVEITNVSRTLAQLKDHGVWIVGAHMGAQSLPLHRAPSDLNYVLVLGNEHKGLHRETLKHCDITVFIPGLQGHMESLNVSVAAGIFFHHFNHSFLNSQTTLK